MFQPCIEMLSHLEDMQVINTRLKLLVDKDVHTYYASRHKNGTVYRRGFSPSFPHTSL